MTEELRTTTEPEIKVIPIELIEEYLSDDYIDELGDELELSNITIDQFNTLFSQLSEGATESDQIIQNIRERLGDDLARVLFKSYDNLTGETLTEEILNDSDSQWKNSLKPMFAEDERKDKLKLNPRRKQPAKATYRSLLSETKHLSYIEFGLPASGFRITVEPMTPRAFGLLKMRIAKEKIVFNRQIYGAKYDLNFAVADGFILEAIMDCVIDSNIKDWTREMLIEQFDDRDFDYLCVRMILPYYPKGYNLRLQCSNVLPETPTEEDEDLDSENTRELKAVECGAHELLKINLNHLIWYNYNITDTERYVMSAQDKKISYDELIEFKEKEELRNNIIAKDNWELELQPTTTINRLLENRRWLNEIEKELIATFNNNVSENMMLERFSEVMTVEELRTYIPYVKTFRTYTSSAREELVSEKDLSALENRDPTVMLLNQLNATDDLEFIFEGITNFIKTNQYALPAYINKACSKCGKPHNAENDEVRLLPLEAKRIFFMIMEHKLQRTVR